VRSIVAGVLRAFCSARSPAALFYLQVLKYDYYHSLSQGNQIPQRAHPAEPRPDLGPPCVVLADNLPASISNWCASRWAT